MLNSNAIFSKDRQSLCQVPWNTIRIEMFCRGCGDVDPEYSGARFIVQRPPRESIRISLRSARLSLTQDRHDEPTTDKVGASNPHNSMLAGEKPEGPWPVRVRARGKVKSGVWGINLGDFTSMENFVSSESRHKSRRNLPQDRFPSCSLERYNTQMGSNIMQDANFAPTMC